MLTKQEILSIEKNKGRQVHLRRLFNNNLQAGMGKRKRDSSSKKGGGSSSKKGGGSSSKKGGGSSSKKEASNPHEKGTYEFEKGWLKRWKMFNTGTNEQYVDKTKGWGYFTGGKRHERYELAINTPSFRDFQHITDMLMRGFYYEYAMDAEVKMIGKALIELRRDYVYDPDAFLTKIQKYMNNFREYFTFWHEKGEFQNALEDLKRVNTEGDNGYDVLNIDLVEAARISLKWFIMIAECDEDDYTWEGRTFLENITYIAKKEGNVWKQYQRK
jgi:hypothetical protein